MEILPFNSIYNSDLKSLGQSLRNYIVSLEYREDDLIVYNTDREMEEYMADFNQWKNVIFLLKEEEQIRGYVIAKIKTETWEWSQIKATGQIEQLFIHENARWKWAWTKLLEACEDFFAIQWVPYMEISVFSENRSALRFYKKYGFEERLIHLDKKIVPRKNV